MLVLAADKNTGNFKKQCFNKVVQFMCMTADRKRATAVKPVN